MNKRFFNEAEFEITKFRIITVIATSDELPTQNSDWEAPIDFEDGGDY